MTDCLRAWLRTGVFVQKRIRQRFQNTRGAIRILLFLLALLVQLFRIADVGVEPRLFGLLFLRRKWMPVLFNEHSSGRLAGLYHQLRLRKMGCFSLVFEHEMETWAAVGHNLFLHG